MIEQQETHSVVGNSFEELIPQNAIQTHTDRHTTGYYYHRRIFFSDELIGFTSTPTDANHHPSYPQLQLDAACNAFISISVSVVCVCFFSISSTSTTIDYQIRRIHHHHHHTDNRHTHAETHLQCNSHCILFNSLQ